MNVKRFTARTAREALALVRQALGDDAVVLSTRPSPDGVEVLALASDGMARIAQAAAQSSVQRAPAQARPAAPAPVALPSRAAALPERIAARGEKLAPRIDARLDPSLDGDLRFGPESGPQPGPDTGPPSRFDPTRSRVLPGVELDSAGSVARDVETLGMSTLTFQDYVRERMLRRRQAELSQQASPPPDALMTSAQQAARPQPAAALRGVVAERRRAEAEPAPDRQQVLRDRLAAPARDLPVLRDEIRIPGPGRHEPGDRFDDAPATGPSPAPTCPPTQPQSALPMAMAANPRERSELMGELRAVRELIDERFGMLAFMERLQRDPRQATLSQKLFDVGLSPALVRKLVQSLPGDAPDELAWALGVIERNLLTDEHDLPVEDHAGVFALIGATGVGKTTSTAKLAAAFATRHGAAQLGLITLDAYRVAAHEQLRTYGRILGVPVHTAHDRASLEDLLELLAGKTLVLIDTAGMAQRDARTRELLEMLQHRAIRKLLVVNAAAQGETLEDVMVAYGVQQCFGVIVSKLDEAVKLGPALDALIRHRAKVVGVANGQRVPEDWHRLSAQALVQRALRGGGGSSWRLDASEVNLMLAATLGAGYPGPQGGASAHPA